MYKGDKKGKKSIFPTQHFLDVLTLVSFIYICAGAEHFTKTSHSLHHFIYRERWAWNHLAQFCWKFLLSDFSLTVCFHFFTEDLQCVRCLVASRESWLSDNTAIEWKCIFAWHLAQFLPREDKWAMLLGLATKMESQMNLVMNKASSSHLVHSCYCKELFAIYFFSDMLNGQELRANPVLGIESNMDRARFRKYINGREV